MNDIEIIRTVIPGAEIKSIVKLGEGGFGSVYSYRTENLARERAVKIIRRESPLDPLDEDIDALMKSGYTREEATAEYRRRERENMLRHLRVESYYQDFVPGNVVQIYDARTFDDPDTNELCFVILMESVQPLKEYLEQLRDPDDRPERRQVMAVRFGMSYCSTLAQMQTVGMCHGDLSLGNSFYSESKQMFLMGDFGEAFIGQAGRGGTPGFQPQSSDIRDINSDLYSVAKLMYIVLTGDPEAVADKRFTTMFFNTVCDFPPVISDEEFKRRKPDCIPELWNCICRAIDLDYRFGAQEMYNELERIDALLSEFEISSDRLLKYKGTEKRTVIIPGYVTGIEDRAFEDDRSVTEIILPDGLTEVGECSFARCSSLTTVRPLHTDTLYPSLPDSVKRLGTGLFKDCRSLKDITLPAGLDSLPGHAFSGCSSLYAVSLPDGITKVSDSAFSECSSLTAVKLGRNTEILEKGTFLNCSSLRDIELPRSLRIIDDSALAGCSGITSLSIPESLEVLGDHALSGCGGLRALVFPDEMTGLGEKALSGCNALESVALPKKAGTIGPYLFEGCSALSEVVLPDGVTSIPDGLFSGCRGLKEPPFPKDPEEIGDRSYADCDFTTVRIPSSVTRIGSRAFSGNTSLNEVSLPSTIAYIGHQAFGSCDIESLPMDKYTILRCVSNLPKNDKSSIMNSDDPFTAFAQYIGIERIDII